MKRLAILLLCAGCSPASLDGFLYSPKKAPPEGYSLSTAIIPRFEEFTVHTTDGETIDAVFAPSNGKHGDVTLVYFFGQGNNIGGAWERMELLYPLGYNLAALDYRGFGKSSGTPSEPGIRIDALAVRTEILRRSGDNAAKLVYYGRSLGGAVAIDLASIAPPGVLIEESTFTSVQALVDDGAYADIPVGAVAESRWDSLAKIRDIVSPFLALHGTADDYVQPRYSVELASAHVRGPTKLVLVDGADHSDVPQRMGLEAYRKAIGEFVSANLK